MKKKALKKLSKALRSGKFRQYRGSCYNVTADAYCVLGVANNLFGGLKADEQEQIYSLVPLTVEATGFPDEMPYFLGVPFHLLNDGRSNERSFLETGIDFLTFDELADLIDIALIDGPKKYFQKKMASL